MGEAPLVAARDVVVEYPTSHARGPGKVRTVRAVAGVSLDVYRRNSLSLVGESGCGKTSLGRAILGLVKLKSGSIQINGQSLVASSGAAHRRIRRNIQGIFQNPYQSLNPRMRIDQMLVEPILAHQLLTVSEARERVPELLSLVGLDPQHARRYPHEFSGGQRQRLSIARALAIGPEFLVCDEPTSSLDVSVRAQILNLLADLRDEMGLTYLLITHDLAVVSSMSTMLAVMYLGRIVEIGETRSVYSQPQHPYTRALLSSAPIPDPIEERKRERIIPSGDVPSPLNRPTGCSFRPRCWLYKELGGPSICAESEPELVSTDSAPTQQSACHFSENMQ